MNSPSCFVVLFGAGGDLSKRLLMPALYNLAKEGLLPNKFALLGVSRKKMDSDEYRRLMAQALQQHFGEDHLSGGQLAEFLRQLHYLSADSSNEESYPQLKKVIEQLDRNSGTEGRVLFYLATPPDLFSKIPILLSSVGLLNEPSKEAWRRVIFEKPFGHDFESAVALNSLLMKVMKEDQIYRIDHYLGKETVQNILVLRFSNGIYEPIWNRRYIKSVQISVAETLGLENRASYYDSAGALRDMVPSHLFQLLSLIGMEPPSSLEADDIRDERVKLIRAIKTHSQEEMVRSVVRGQYGPGVISGTKVPGYRNEPGISPNSQTETFVAMRLEIENWRWSGVPFYIRTGKRMERRLTEVIIEFHPAPFHMFRGTACDEFLPTLLIMQIQPEEKISLALTAKVPGPVICLGRVVMEFDYHTTFGSVPKTGYETLLLDAMKGDPTLFRRADEVEAAWKVVDPILQAWSTSELKRFSIYTTGGWGPQAAFELLDRDHQTWFVSAQPQPARRPSVPERPEREVA